ncbi:hypothetical protein ASF61_03135 [Duganella sp. Leaf126]|uniref:DUF5694 domain-containing protein n=1 Tax=Duganella sp. Leaf126 TaxID=1736266 RepID=UPI0006F402F4|nr:DUF5694 domain-containing protein [Duganella sp. Leaf126]KQQ47638.1 hypothetical protein ASF61_03135 [Duganella sp. Leaf126]
MTKWLITGPLVAAFACHAAVATAQAAGPQFDPSSRKLVRGQTNEVMVLGSAHLSQLRQANQPFDATTLQLLNARLVAWQPQAVAIEALSGVQCANMRAYPQRYADTIKSYCRDTSAAQAATGLDVFEATERTEQLLAAWPTAPSAPTAAQRRQLASLFLAAGEPTSALVQWLRLPATERREGDGLNTALVAALNQLQVRPDESCLIAAQVAAQSGLERLYPIDDHTSDKEEPDQKAAGAAIMKAWDNPATAQRTRTDTALQSQTTAAGVLAMYRAYNDPAQAALVFRSDFGAALEEPSPQHYGRGYVTYWETRNLRMASNIRDAMSPPGRRMLVIVGASHKFYLEAYLNQMHDVRIVATDAVLNPPD